jgi:hypothetical protein
MRTDEALSMNDLQTIAEEAYVFSFPIQMGYRAAFGMFMAAGAPSYRGPLNQLHSDPQTLDHTFREVISPNADTPYSMAGLDLRAEPQVFEVPEVTDRYYVMQFEDLFGTNPYYVGTRATGTSAGSYLLVGPRYEGEIPGGFSDVLRFETDLVFIIGRTQLLGPDDLDALRAVMNRYRLSTLSAYQGKDAQPAPPFDWPLWDDAASRDERFIGYVNRLLELCQPTHPSEVELMARFARAGIGAGVPFDAASLSNEVRTALRAGVDSARVKISTRAESSSEKVNGWAGSDAFGDRSFFNGDYLLRAAAAMAGWGGNDKIEAFYPTSREDADGKPLHGENRYRLTLATAPPARAFWSVTMYDTTYDGTAGYLVENPISRYLINSTTQGLVRGDDGSLTITIQHDRPDSPEAHANWLPAPDGPFYLVLRIYMPEPAAWDGTWTLPQVQRI